MLVYRIVHKEYAATLGASGRDGRWNSGGRKVIYTASSFALAFTENMYYRRGAGFNEDYKTVVVYVPENLGILILLETELPAGWRDVRHNPQGQSLGNRWFDEMRFPVLKVPSAIIPQEYNFVLNTLHPDFSKIRILETGDFLPDPRIESILKNWNEP
jgi:RES domain-containing protein